MSSGGENPSTAGGTPPSFLPTHTAAGAGGLYKRG